MSFRKNDTQRNGTRQNVMLPVIAMQVLHFNHYTKLHVVIVLSFLKSSTTILSVILSIRIKQLPDSAYSGLY